MSHIYDTKYLSMNADGLFEASRALGRGELVAFPTETVYGLGGISLLDSAVESVFRVKLRPAINPLIAHVSSPEMVEVYADINPLAEKLMDKFWPGGLTLVLHQIRPHRLSTIMTHNSTSVAVRCPAHDFTRSLIKEVGFPIAAPSANKSGQISPTCAKHVMDGLHGLIPFIVDGGPTKIGIESTIIDVSTAIPSFLRPGAISYEEIEDFLGIQLKRSKKSTPIIAPGALSSHYAPKAKVRLNVSSNKNNEAFLGFGQVKGAALNLSEKGDLEEAAHNLFAYLHDLDNLGYDTIAVSPIPKVGLGVAINDRLKRAAAPRVSL